MGLRGPKPAANPGQTIGVHLDGGTLARLNDLTTTRNRRRNFLAAAALRAGLPLLAALEEVPEPRASKHPAATVTVYVDGDTLSALDGQTTKRDRTRSFLGAAAIRLGLPTVAKKYRPVKKAAKKKGARGKKVAAAAAK
jgi:predicted transcriptional regulator